MADKHDNMRYVLIGTPTPYPLDPSMVILDISNNKEDLIEVVKTMHQIQHIVNMCGDIIEKIPKEILPGLMHLLKQVTHIEFGNDEEKLGNINGMSEICIFKTEHIEVEQ